MTEVQQSWLINRLINQCIVSFFKQKWQTFAPSVWELADFLCFGLLVELKKRFEDSLTAIGRTFYTDIHELIDPLTFPPAPPTCQISCLHACLSSAAWKSRILCTLFNFRCLIVHFLHPVCLKRAVEILSGSHGDRQTLQTIKNLYSSGCLLGYKKIKGEGGGLNFRSLHVHIPAFIYVLFSDHRPHWSLTKESISPSTYGWETAE